MSRRSILATALAVILSLPVAVLAQEPSSQPKSADFLPEGSPAPAFALKDLAGNEVDIRRYLGKSPIVLS
ncbi:MAG: hypothetical protein JSV00_09790, partial [bacterium]